MLSETVPLLQHEARSNYTQTATWLLLQDSQAARRASVKKPPRAGSLTS